jgi:hypothetical protein
MDPYEIEAASSGGPADPNLPSAIRGQQRAFIPGGRGPASGGPCRGRGDMSEVVAAIAATIINSAVITHSIIITVIMMISVLTAALGLH